MKILKNLQDRLEGFIHATNRYPLTMIFLIVTAIASGSFINTELDGSLKYLFTFLVGALLSMVGQQIYERFFMKLIERLILMFGSVVLTAGYFFVIKSTDVFNIETGTITGITIFTLILTFIWIPTIKSEKTFNDSFMSTFKALFITLLYTAIITGGISLIIFAIDTLLFSVNSKTILHALSIIYTLFAPVFFLSFTPLYLGKKDKDLSIEELTIREDQIQKAISSPKNLRILISYIIIPLTAMYTVILLAYILINISGDFWTHNVLEPLLVSYAITVIIVYVLASNLDNKFVNYFRVLFPKILVPIVLFQTIASILKINEMGLTHGRYYVILFGIFAIVAGLVFSFMPVRKNGIIVPVFIVLATLSITPPIDAFSVSRVNQINLLELTLEENHMLKNDIILSNPDISNKDKIVITKTINYIDQMNYTGEIDWFPNDVFYSNNFQKTFGFLPQYDVSSDGFNQGQSANLNWDNDTLVNIEGYDRMLQLFINSPVTDSDTQTFEIEKDGLSYKLIKELDGEYFVIRLINEKNDELIRFNTMEIFNTILGEYGDKMLTVEEATLTKENENVKMSILTNYVDGYNSQYNADVFVFIQLK